MKTLRQLLSVRHVMGASIVGLVSYLNRWAAVQGVKNVMLLELLLAAVIAPAFAVADPNIQLDMQVKKEIIIEEDGQQVTQ